MFARQMLRCAMYLPMLRSYRALETSGSIILRKSMFSVGHLGARFLALFVLCLLFLFALRGAHDGKLLRQICQPLNYL